MKIRVKVKKIEEVSGSGICVTLDGPCLKMPTILTFTNANDARVHAFAIGAYVNIDIDCGT